MMVNILTELAALRKSREHKTPARINRENKTPARMDGRRIFENSLGLPTFILCTGQKPPTTGQSPVFKAASFAHFVLALPIRVVTTAVNTLCLNILLNYTVMGTLLLQLISKKRTFAPVLHFIKLGLL